MSVCPAAAPSASLSRRSGSREDRDPQRIERRARRAGLIVTDTADGAQRLVKAKDIAADPLRAELSKQLRMGKSGNVEVGDKRLFLNVYAPTAKLVIVGAVHISQALAPLARALDY